MIEIRFHGRGGQGAVTAAKILSNALLIEGKYSQYFAEFGIERRGAPVKAFLRIDEKEILIRSAIYSPDIVVIFDLSLIESANATMGLKENGWLLINTVQRPVDFLGLGMLRTATVNATDIAINKKIGSKNQPIVNTIMTGAIAKILGISFESLKKAIEKEFGEKANKNIEGAKEAYEGLEVGPPSLKLRRGNGGEEK